MTYVYRTSFYGQVQNKYLVIWEQVLETFRCVNCYSLEGHLAICRQRASHLDLHSIKMRFTSISAVRVCTDFFPLELYIRFEESVSFSSFLP